MNPDLLRYMIAHIALHCKEGSSVGLWPARQVLDTFALLPPPAVDLATWATRMNAMVEPAEPAQEDRTGELNAAGVRMAEQAKDLQRDGVLSIKDA